MRRMAILLALVLVGCGGGGSTDEATSPTTQRFPSVTNLPAPTTTIRYSRETQVAAFVQAFEPNRNEIAEAIQSQHPVVISSVDRIEVDPERPALVIAFSCPYDIQSYVDDLAWEVTASLKKYWEPSNLKDIPDALPVFDLTVNESTYVCPGEFMAQLGDLRAGRAQWEAACS